MAEHQITIEEYIWLAEYHQGNVNIAGLVFDDLIEEELSLDVSPYVVWVDIVEDTFNLEEGDFVGNHWPVCSDSIDFSEYFGYPLRVRQTAINVLMTDYLVPVQICHVHLNILHGPDTYWEELGDDLILNSYYVNAVPYHREWVYESIDIDMTEPQPYPPVTKAVKLSATDIINVRHTVEQEYFFNSKCFERFFMWDDQIWGWSKALADSMAAKGDIQEIIGKTADEHLIIMDQDAHKAKTSHILSDVVFSFDRAKDEKYYLLDAAESLEIAENAPGWAQAAGLVEVLSIGDIALPAAVLGGLATESLVFADVASFAHDLIVEEGLEIGDIELVKWTYQVLLASGFDLTDIIG